MTQANSALPAELIEAYQQTYYYVHATIPFSLQIGEGSGALKALYDQLDVHQCAFITAYNPYSEPTDQMQNIDRQSQLQRLVQDQGYRFIEGIGQHPSGCWAGEPSVLIFDIPLKKAFELAEQFGQNAFVWIDQSASPTLHFLR